MANYDWKCPGCGWEIRDTDSNAELGYLVSDHQTSCGRVRSAQKPTSGGCAVLGAGLIAGVLGAVYGIVELIA
jgi:hypothetical protein